ncbi:MAG: polyphosphate polymerase domain-containing protein [Ilumatobacteraceae bacterium]
MSAIVLADFARLAPIDLDELNESAALQTRTDRKYVVGPHQLGALIDHLHDDVRVLDIDGRRMFGYESVYFDTPRFDSFLGAAHRRPHRFKVRTRRYLDSDRSSIEVKVRSGRGQTVKHRRPHRCDDHVLDAADERFLREFAPLVPNPSELVPSLRTRYDRTTITIGGSRATIDLGVTCTRDGSAVGLGDQIIIETKSAGAASEVDRALWAIHQRPVSISKYGVGLAALLPELPANKWHRVMCRHVRHLDRR